MRERRQVARCAHAALRRNQRHRIRVEQSLQRVDHDPANARVAPAEAEQLREMFGLYLKEESLLRVVETINERGWRTKSWTTKKGEAHDGSPWALLLCC